MIAVITGDIIDSRTLDNQEKWITPFKELLSSWGDYPKYWELKRGDFFQIEIEKPEEALKKAFEIKALIKKIEPYQNKKTSPIDVRIAIGIGEKSYSGASISENNGSAYINAGGKFDVLEKENVTMGIKSPWKDFDNEMNLYLKLAGLFMDKWTSSSAEVVEIILNNRNITQEEIGKQLEIKQNSVSGRRNRAHIDEVLEVESRFRTQLKKHITC